MRELDWKAKRKLALGQHIKLYDKEYTVTGVLGRRGYLIGNRGMTYRLAQSQIRQVALLPSTIQEH